MCLQQVLDLLAPSSGTSQPWALWEINVCFLATQSVVICHSRRWLCAIKWHAARYFGWSLGLQHRCPGWSHSPQLLLLYSLQLMDFLLAFRCSWLMDTGDLPFPCGHAAMSIHRNGGWGQDYCLTPYLMDWGVPNWGEIIGQENNAPEKEFALREEAD